MRFNIIVTKSTPVMTPAANPGGADEEEDRRKGEEKSESDDKIGSPGACNDDVYETQITKRRRKKQNKRQAA
jgi:hypothetical protein